MKMFKSDKKAAGIAKRLNIEQKIHGVLNFAFLTKNISVIIYVQFLYTVFSSATIYNI